jgi:hypothetical protein
MRLLERGDNGELSLTEDLVGDNFPAYGILSHRWNTNTTEEVTFKDLVGGTGKGKAGYDKIKFCAEQAERDGLQYFWVDTCCIDKSNNTELSEAINSMFRWYRDAARCWVYLSDVSINDSLQTNDQPKPSWEPAFRASRWFTRGWTLQELLAPATVEFFTQEGVRLGNKRSLEQEIHKITGIPIPALQGTSLSRFGVDERFAWAETRQTTRAEDWAYGLLGIFGVFIPPIYGEGREHAIRRLRKEIDDMKRQGVNFSNLYFVKTRNEGSGRTEVHIAEKANNYGIPTGHHVSGYGPNEGENGVFVINDGDLYFIKLRSTGTGTVEIHRTTGASRYTTFDIHSGSAFSLEDLGNGTWTVDGADLYFIKTKNTASGKIEVHRAGHQNYNVFDMHEATSISSGEDGNGTWQIFGGRLYFIKYRNTRDSSVEVHILDRNKNYQRGTVYQSWFNIKDAADNGTWDIGLNGDLYFIKTRNAESGQIEVHVATAETNYRQVYHYATWISQADGPNGIWCVS